MSRIEKKSVMSSSRGKPSFKGRFWLTLVISTTLFFLFLVMILAFLPVWWGMETKITSLITSEISITFPNPREMNKESIPFSYLKISNIGQGQIGNQSDDQVGTIEIIPAQEQDTVDFQSVHISGFTSTSLKLKDEEYVLELTSLEGNETSLQVTAYVNGAAQLLFPPDERINPLPTGPDSEDSSEVSFLPIQDHLTLHFALPENANFALDLEPPIQKIDLKEVTGKIEFVNLITTQEVDDNGRKEIVKLYRDVTDGRGFEQLELSELTGELPLTVRLTKDRIELGFEGFIKGIENVATMKSLKLPILWWLREQTNWKLFYLGLVGLFSVVLGAITTTITRFKEILAYFKDTRK